MRWLSWLKIKSNFKKSISIHGFISQLGTEEQCRKRLFDMRWPAGYRCDNCGHDKYCELKSRQLFQCNLCHYQGLLTSGTLFSASKLGILDILSMHYFRLAAVA